MMGCVLCVCEKPSVGRDIARVIGAFERKNGYLEGNGYIVTWAIGHLVGLAEPEEYGFVEQREIYGDFRETAYNELPLLPDDWKLTVLKKTKSQFEIVKKLMHREDIDYIIDCGDMGSEGHILQWLIREKAGNTKPVKRFCATDMTDEAIKTAMNNLRPISDFENVIRGELCKKKCDWILGMSMSRCVTLKYRVGINVGRVQSPTLFFIVKRWMEVIKFKQTDYYALQVSFKEGFKCSWNKDQGAICSAQTKDSEGRVIDRTEINNKALEIKKSGIGIVSMYKRQRRMTDRPQLYDITELQRDANKIYGYTASETLATAQALYESQKVLSYPRTDSRYITSNLLPYLGDRLKQIATLPEYQVAVDRLLEVGPKLDKKIVSDADVTDHHALIVTGKINCFKFSKMSPTPDESKKGVTSESMKNILHLVIVRMIVALSKEYLYDETLLNITFPNGMNFSSSGRKIISQGWKTVQAELTGDLQIEDGGGENEGHQILPELREGQQLKVTDVDVISKRTTPPKLHTEATLLTAMENAGSSIQDGQILKGKGIGTQATRAEIIKKLFDKEYVKTECNKGKIKYIVPTDKGIGAIKVIPPDLVSPKITADWETKISDIVNGEYTEELFMKSFVEFIREKVQEVKFANVENVKFSSEREVYGICPWCGNDIYKSARKDGGGKIYSFGYYCSKKCGFSIGTDNRYIEARTGKKLTESQIKKFISKGTLVLNCINKNQRQYKGEFFFEKKSGETGQVSTIVGMKFPKK